MPRRRPKTAADRPTCSVPSPRLAPEAIEPFLAVLEFHRLVKTYGAADVQAGLNVIAEHERHLMIERRSSQMLDAWKSETRPVSPVRIPRAVGGRQWRRHHQTREQRLDKMIFEQARLRELDAGLSVIQGSHIDEWKKREFAQIVNLIDSGQTAKQIAEALGVSERTVEGRLKDLRDAAG